MRAEDPSSLSELRRGTQRTEDRSRNAEGRVGRCGSGKMEVGSRNAEVGKKENCGLKEHRAGSIAHGVKTGDRTNDGRVSGFSPAAGLESRQSNRNRNCENANVEHRIMNIECRSKVFCLFKKRLSEAIPALRHSACSTFDILRFSC